MVQVKREGVILGPTNLPFENKGVLNPAVVKEGNTVHLFYRAWNKEGFSTIGYAKLDGPIKVVERLDRPFMKHETDYDRQLEDPRIVKIDDTYYMTYVAYDGKNVRMAYATSNDLKSFTKKGTLMPDITYDEAEDYFRQSKPGLKDRYYLFEAYFKVEAGRDVLLWDKDAFFFPKKINGKYALVHRILPDIQIIYFDDFPQLTLDYWKDYFKNLKANVILESRHWFETRNIGGGSPPIETKDGWLLIYHAVDDMDSGRTYRMGAALLDINDPTKVIGHLDKPLLSPKEPYEKDGNTDNVVFPTGTALFDNRLYIYYGAADTTIAVCSVDMNELLEELKKPSTADENN